MDWPNVSEFGFKSSNSKLYWAVARDKKQKKLNALNIEIVFLFFIHLSNSHSCDTTVPMQATPQ